MEMKPRLRYDVETRSWISDHSLGSFSCFHFLLSLFEACQWRWLPETWFFLSILVDILLHELCLFFHSVIISDRQHSLSSSLVLREASSRLSRRRSLSPYLLTYITRSAFKEDPFINAPASQGPPAHSLNILSTVGFISRHFSR